MNAANQHDDDNCISDACNTSAHETKASEAAGVNTNALSFVNPCAAAAVVVVVAAAAAAAAASHSPILVQLHS